MFLVLPVGLVWTMQGSIQERTRVQRYVADFRPGVFMATEGSKVRISDLQVDYRGDPHLIREGQRGIAKFR